MNGPLGRKTGPPKPPQPNSTAAASSKQAAGRGTDAMWACWMVTELHIFLGEQMSGV